MAKLLHIDSSSRDERSHSRLLTREFINTWLKFHPADTVVYRDVGHYPLPHVDEQWVAAVLTPAAERTPQMRQALLASDELIDELLDADLLVIGLPMYNFGVPSSLKAYIDHIVRIGHTVAFDPEDQNQPYKPLVHGKRAFLIVATGIAGYESGGYLAQFNHVDPYLRTVLGFIGVTDLNFVHVVDDKSGGEQLSNSLLHARARIAELASSPDR